MNELKSTATFGQYLSHNIDNGVIDFSIRAQKTRDGLVEFYIHPASVSGETKDYVLMPGGVGVYNKNVLDNLLHAAFNSTNG